MTKIVLVAIARIHVSAMFLQVVCPHCKHPFEIDDADCTANACPNCDGEWGCNVDAESAWEADLEFDVPTHHQTIDSHGQLVDDWQRIAAKPRSRRRESSLLSKIIPPILGGLTAVPIALAILWYGFGKDLGNAGPTVARYAPWIVPEPLRGISRRNLNIERATPSPSQKPRDFGTMGSRARDLSSNELPYFESSRPASSNPSPALLYNNEKRIDRILANLEEAAKKWDSTPIRQQQDLQSSVFEWTQTLAEVLRTQPTAMDDPTPIYKSLVNLAVQSWFVDTVEQATTKSLSKGRSPEVFESIVWTAQTIKVNAGAKPLQNCTIDPPLTIGSQSVQWFANEPIAEQIRTLLPIPQMRLVPGIGPAPSSGRRLIFGRVERIDERGYFIRIEAIIPH